MKKLIIRILIALVVLVIVAALAVHFLLDSAIKRGVETVGPMLTKTDIKLNSVSLSILSGSGKLKGLVVGNPEGYKAPSAINLGLASLAVEPKSVLADKVVIRHIRIEAPEITYETDLKKSNLSKIMENVDAATGGGQGTTPGKEPAPAQSGKAAKKLQVDDFLITGGKIHVSLTALAGKGATVPLPDIHFTNLGQGPDGITAAELTKQVLREIEKGAAQAAAGSVADLSKMAGDLTKDLGKGASGTVEKATKGVTDLFKKKQ